ncbi:glycerate kinase [bacterium]|nr:glycerate kinase [bacterium]
MNEAIERKNGEGKAMRDAEAIFRSALARVDPALMVRSAVRVGDGTISFATELEKADYRLADYNRIVVAGFGKAGASMARGLEEALAGTAAERLLSGGVVAVKRGHLDRLERTALMEASHPVPDASSAAAAAAVLALADGADERTLAIVLISGGGSALLCAPAQGISLEDKAATTSLLLGSGAPIQEVNCVRKHLSAVKGGRLAAAFAPATVVSLILSDVIGDDLDAIASGPTAPDPTTWADALAIVRRRGIEAALPPAVAELLRRGAAGGEGAPADTPKADDPAFARTRNLLVGTNRLALMAAESEARGLGYSTLVLTSRLTGEAREAALMLLGMGKDIAASGFPLRRPACLLVGGETTVTLRGKGRGGRNQEMALAFLAAAARAPKDSGDLVFLAASTDGSDGPTDAAGAFASATLLGRARSAGLDPEAYLADNDSYAFFDKISGLLRTGPTNTNVCDLQVLIVPGGAAS